VGTSGRNDSAVLLRPRDGILNNPLKEEPSLLAIAGTGYGLIGILVIILLVVLIFYFVRRA
jgi:hypothetical protein